VGGVRDEGVGELRQASTCDMRKNEEEITGWGRGEGEGGGGGCECLVVQLICRGLNEERKDKYRRTLCPI